MDFILQDENKTKSFTTKQKIDFFFVKGLLKVEGLNDWYFFLLVDNKCVTKVCWLKYVWFNKNLLNLLNKVYLINSLNIVWGIF